MKKTITLKLKMSELIYDIQNKTYLTGRSINNGSSVAHIAHMQANDDDENAAQILRSITMATAVLRNRLGEYLDNSETLSDNEILSQEEDILFTLYMPGNFNSSVAHTIGEATHQFIVATAVADWFAITAKGETSDYTLAAGEALKVMEESLCKRSRPNRVAS